MAEKKKYQRSPNYPSMGLSTAIEKLKSLYEREKTAPVVNDVAVKAWGYNSVSGPALQTIASVAQFGLIERAGKQKIKITELGLDILLPKSIDDRARAIQEAANRPTIFRELINQYPTDLPSDDTLKAYLLRRPVPYTEESSKKLIKSFRETRELVKLPEVKSVENKELEFPIFSPSTPVIPKPPLQKPKEGDFVLNIPLKGRIATLIIPSGEPTIKDLDTIKDFMDFYKKVNAVEEPKE